MGLKELYLGLLRKAIKNPPFSIKSIRLSVILALFLPGCITRTTIKTRPLQKLTPGWRGMPIILLSTRGRRQNTRSIRPRALLSFRFCVLT